MKRLLVFCLAVAAFLIQGTANMSSTNTRLDSKALVEIDGETYMFARINQVNWYEAVVECRNINMQLVSFETEKKWNSFVDFITANPALERFWWTSGHRSPERTDFIWTSTGAVFNFTAWNSAQPNLIASEDACVNFVANTGGWEDDDCTYNTFAYICENIPE